MNQITPRTTKTDNTSSANKRIKSILLGALAAGSIALGACGAATDVGTASGAPESATPVAASPGATPPAIAQTALEQSAEQIINANRRINGDPEVAVPLTTTDDLFDESMEMDADEFEAVTNGYSYDSTVENMQYGLFHGVPVGFTQSAVDIDGATFTSDDVTFSVSVTGDVAEPGWAGLDYPMYTTDGLETYASASALAYMTPAIDLGNGQVQLSEQIFTGSHWIVIDVNGDHDAAWEAFNEVTASLFISDPATYEAPEVTDDVDIATVPEDELLVDNGSTTPIESDRTGEVGGDGVDDIDADGELLIENDLYGFYYGAPIGFEVEPGSEAADGLQLYNANQQVTIQVLGLDKVEQLGDLAEGWPLMTNDGIDTTTSRFAEGYLLEQDLGNGHTLYAFQVNTGAHWVTIETFGPNDDARLAFNTVLSTLLVMDDLA